MAKKYNIDQCFSHFYRLSWNEEIIMGRIVIANSLNQHDLDSLEVGLDWSSKLGLEASVVHADRLADYNALDPVFAHLNIEIHQEYLDNLLKANEAGLVSQIKKINPDFESFHYQSLAGNPVEVISNESEKDHCELIVMGKRDDKSWAEAFMGSVSEGVLHRSHKSILLVKNKSIKHPKKIVVAYDFSKLCDKALNWSKRLAEIFQCEIHVVNIVPCYYEGYHVAHTMRSDFNDAIKGMIDESVKKIDERLINKIGSYFTTEKVIGKTLVDDKASISGAITSYASEVGADLIISGSHQRNKLAEFFMGSVSTKLAKKAKTSVLVAK